MFQLKVDVQGVDTSFQGIGAAGAEGRAQREAARLLEYALERMVEPVPCPACGAYQRDMFAELGRRSTDWKPLVIAILFSFAGMAAITTIHSLCVPREAILSDPVAIGITALLAVLAGLGGVALLRDRRRRVWEYDPNAEMPQEERLKIAANYPAMLLPEFQTQYPDATAAPFR